ncbi:hypothetical protein ACA910_022228 [Epithemia clementina (nom. ined.)]
MNGARINVCFSTKNLLLCLLLLHPDFVSLIQHENLLFVVHAQEDTLVNNNNNNNNKNGGGFAGWTCDALIPNLCDLSVETNVVEMRGGIQVRYWKYRNKYAQNDDTMPSSSSTSSRPTPPPPPSLIVLHGGPAVPHQYLLPLKQIACTRPQREVIFYDQGGCGGSKVPNANPQNVPMYTTYPWLFDPNYYAEELAQLIDSLGIERYHILGHSWGTMLAQIFALNYRSNNNNNNNSKVRTGLLSMALAGCISDTQLYIKEQWDPIHGTLGAQLPPFVEQRSRFLEEAQLYDSPEYQALVDVMTVRFTTRTAPLPDCFVQAVADTTPEIYVGMQGASEFTLSGVLANFNVTGRLRNALGDLPIWLSSGAYDTVRPKVVETMHQQLPLSERVLFPKSGHVTAIDEAGLMNELVSDFLYRVEQAEQLGVPFVPLQQHDQQQQRQKSNRDETESTLLLSSSSSNDGNDDDDTERSPLSPDWMSSVLIAIACGSVGFVLGVSVGRTYYEIRRPNYETIP